MLHSGGDVAIIEGPIGEFSSVDYNSLDPS